MVRWVRPAARRQPGSASSSRPSWPDWRAPRFATAPGAAPASRRACRGDHVQVHAPKASIMFNGGPLSPPSASWSGTEKREEPPEYRWSRSAMLCKVILPEKVRSSKSKGESMLHLPRVRAPFACHQRLALRPCPRTTRVARSWMLLGLRERGPASRSTHPALPLRMSSHPRIMKSRPTGES